MAAAWPYPDNEAMLQAADAIWLGLTPDDWLEAFRAHPRIGERTSSSRSQQEQAGVRSASAEQMAELEKLNRDYEERFGYIFIVCASGKTTEQFLEALRERLNNPPGVELRIAAGEQRQITRLRLSQCIGQREDRQI